VSVVVVTVSVRTVAKVVVVMVLIVYCHVCCYGGGSSTRFHWCRHCECEVVAGMAVPLVFEGPVLGPMKD